MRMMACLSVACATAIVVASAPASNAAGPFDENLYMYEWTQNPSWRFTDYHY